VVIEKAFELDWERSESI